MRQALRPLIHMLFGAFALVALVACDGEPPAARPAEAKPLVTVYKSPSCGCCTGWVEHLQANGFDVDVRDGAVNPIKARLGVPERLWSCHTGVVGGYAIEGHVPAEDIHRLLAERPQAKGLAVPGMPVGSPGMEQGDQREPYEVVLFGEREPSIWARH